MTYKIEFSTASSDQIETALCTQLQRIRLARNITQAQLAKEAGVSLKTIGRLEKGLGVSLDTFVRVLTALRVQQSLEGLLPDPSVRPVDRIDLGGSERKRARSEASAVKDLAWVWGDENGQ